MLALAYLAATFGLLAATLPVFAYLQPKVNR